MKITKFKSSLLTTTLISTSLFGSKPNPEMPQLPREGKQEVAQTIAIEDVLPPLTQKIINLFNYSLKVQELKKEYDLKQQEFDTKRIEYGKTLAGKQHTQNRIRIERKLSYEATRIAIREYEKTFKSKLAEALKNQGFEEYLFDFFTFL